MHIPEIKIDEDIIETFVEQEISEEVLDEIIEEESPAIPEENPIALLA